MGPSKRTSSWVGWAVFCGSVVLALSAAAASRAARQGTPVTEEQVARGKYLVTIGSCNDCHTPWKVNEKTKMPEQDWSRMLSGHPAGAPDPASELKPGDLAVIGPTFTAFRMPFGVVYTANLTPDKATGLGEWTEEMFVRALRTGKHMGGEGRAILPPMPWPLIGQMSDADLKAVFAYLRSIPAIRNDVPEHKVPLEVVNAISVATKDALQVARRGR